MKWSAEKLALRYRFLESRLRDSELQEPDPEDLEPIDETDLRTDLPESRRPHHFLDYFSRRGLEILFTKLGFFRELRQRGFAPHVAVDLRDPARHLLQIYDGKPAQRRLLVEIAGRRDTFLLGEGDELPRARYRFFVVDWMLLQNPRATFTESRPRLPGQDFPGLGMGTQIGEILALMAARLQCDGILACPNHFHNACLYSRRMWFLEPEDHGTFLAIRDAVGDLGLARGSWAVEWGCVRENGTPYRWPGARMLLPLSDVLADYLSGASYRQRCEAARRGRNFALDRTCLANHENEARKSAGGSA